MKRTVDQLDEKVLTDYWTRYADSTSCYAVPHSKLRSFHTDLPKAYNWLSKRHTIHSVHPYVKKTNIPLEFEINPNELSEDNRCVVRLTDVVDLYPCYQSEITNDAKLKSRENYSPLLVPVSVRNLRYNNPCPFRLTEKTNMWELHYQYTENIGSEESFFKSMEERSKIEMPLLPSKLGMKVLEGKFQGSPKDDWCMKPPPIFEPVMARIYGSMTEELNGGHDTLMNGIYWLECTDPWEEIDEGETWGVLPSDHILTIFSRLNFDVFSLLFKVYYDGNNLWDKKDEPWVLLMRKSTIMRLRNELLKRAENALPFCAMDEIVFELQRHQGGYKWTGKNGVDPEEAETFLNNTYSVKVDIEMTYTLFSQDDESAYISYPGSDFSVLHMDTEKELEKYHMDAAKNENDEEEALLNFAQMKLDMEK